MSTSERGDRREQGMGSVEMILILPFYLILLLLMIHGSRLMLLNEAGAVATRNAAWRASLHRDYGSTVLGSTGLPSGLLPDVGRHLCSQTEIIRTFGGEFQLTQGGFLGGLTGGTAVGGWLACAPGDDSDGEDFVSDMVDAGGGGIDDIVREPLDDAPPPYFTTVRGASRYEAVEQWKAFRVTDPFEWETQHSLSANRVWERAHLGDGFDEQLKDALGLADALFADVFPGAD